MSVAPAGLYATRSSAVESEPTRFRDRPPRIAASRRNSRRAFNKKASRLMPRWPPSRVGRKGVRRPTRGRAMWPVCDSSELKARSRAPQADMMSPTSRKRQRPLVVDLDDVHLDAAINTSVSSGALRNCRISSAVVARRSLQDAPRWLLPLQSVFSYFFAMRDGTA